MSPSFTVVEVTLRVWDDHMSRCGECLTEGQHLCYEGEYLTEKVVQARQAVRNASEGGVRFLLSTLLSRPMLPGVGA
ncbi:MAG TPA: hypothetical protein VFG07_06970 [Thermoplasmata archaeon]|nr:hypothetical protein [Thermoplasmata archaeon]